jgi:hypothetical protein
MELFGYVCSPLCKAKADSHGIDVPVFAGQASVAEARLWRKTVWAGSAVFAYLAIVLGGWFWYAWFGSTPKSYFSVRFENSAASGESWFAGKDQIVLLHGDTLARYDMRTKKEIWSRHLVDPKEIDAEIAREMKSMQVAIDRANNDHPDFVPKMPNPEKLKKQLKRAAEEELDLKLNGQNIWVSSSGKLTRYDWDTGSPGKEISVQGGFRGMIPRGNEMLMLATDADRQTVTRINLDTCESRTEEIGSPKTPALAGSDKMAGKTNASRTTLSDRSRETAGLPLGTPGRDAGKAMDPSKVAQQAQNLSTPAKIALPALLANSRNQERTMAELNGQSDEPGSKAGARPSREVEDRLTLIPAKDGFVQFAVRMIEPHFTARSAMKARPAKSALDGAVTVAKTTEIANEILNDMQRDRGGDIVEEDESRYLVSVRRPDTGDSWSGEVIGPPNVFPLETVNVITGNKILIVLDKHNKKLWQSSMNYKVAGGLDALDEDNARYGQGPCVERKNSLYVFDQGVLTAFDLANGNARWRYPSVGIAGLFFDEQGMIYVNTTTASLSSIRYSRQIDISSKAVSVLAKLDPASGKVLWTAEPGGLLNYCSGKFLYAMNSHAAEDDEEDNPYKVDTGLELKPFLRIKRIDPKNGHVLWEHFQQRAPIDVQFDKNSIRLVFKNEVQVLKFIVL